MCEYERNLAINSKKNSKSVNSYINKKSKIKDSIKAIKLENGAISTDNSEIAHTLNEIFASVLLRITRYNKHLITNAQQNVQIRISIVQSLKNT